MQTALELFRDNINRVRRLTEAHSLLIRHEPDQDFSDILRAQYVLTISTLDTFIHNVIRIGMVETLQGRRRKSDGYKAFTITMSLVEFDPTYEWFDSELRRRLTKETYQNPYQILEGILYIFDDTKKLTDSKFWKSVADNLGETDHLKITRRLNEITERRNKIVHEADIQPIPSMPGTLWEIDESSVSDMINFIERVAEAIFSIVNQNVTN